LESHPDGRIEISTLTWAFVDHFGEIHDDAAFPRSVALERHRAFVRTEDLPPKSRWVDQ
jgi:hypothetical protein